ncbi:MAG TPA: TIGR03118 family protein [Phycisphaerae bacterium]|jgi:uncharacterized protein (TIGR03118 family)
MRSFKYAAAVTAVLITSHAALADDNTFDTTVLVANSADYDPQIIDPNMINAWGIALRPPGAGGHIWVDDARSGTSVEYIGDVNGQPLHQDGLTVVPLDIAGFADKGYASVTGLAYNAASDLPGQAVEFPVSGPATNDSTNPPTSAGIDSGSAKFIFVTKDGTINAWRTNTASAMNTAPVVINYSKTAPSHPFTANPVFTGVAMSTHAVTSTDPALGNKLYATDFRNNNIEVFNNQWTDITSSVQFATPATVGDLHNFNVMDLAGHLFVTYATWDPASDEGFEDIPGEGHLVEYNEDGSLVKDFSGGDLNSPWGVAIAPAGFGKFGGDILVSNFGDGSIAAFDPLSGNFIDDLRDSNGDPLAIDGLWGLTFGNGVSLGDANTLYYTAGPNGEQDGLLGKVTVAVPEPASMSLLFAGSILLLARRRRRT